MTPVFWPVSPNFLWHLSSPTKIVRHHHPGALLFEVLLRRGYLSRCATSRCINHRWCTMSFGTKELFVARLLEPSGLGWDGGWIKQKWNGRICRQQFGNSTYTLSIYEVGEWPDFFSDDQETVTWNHGSINTFQPQLNLSLSVTNQPLKNGKQSFHFEVRKVWEPRGVLVLMMFDIAPPKTNMSPEKWPF